MTTRLPAGGTGVVGTAISRCNPGLVKAGGKASEVGLCMGCMLGYFAQLKECFSSSYPDTTPLSNRYLLNICCMSRLGYKCLLRTSKGAGIYQILLHRDNSLRGECERRERLSHEPIHG